MSIDVFVANRIGLADALVSDFQAEGRNALAARDRFTVAIPGGSVASTFFARFAGIAFDWSRTEFFWTDERAVPPSDRDSNYTLASSLWLGPAGVPAARIHRMEGEALDLASAARTYADQLRQVAGRPPRLDFVLLGVGPDGHVASLFPGWASVPDEDNHVAVVEDAPKPPHRRLTLTMPVLAGAGRVVIAALGAAKARAIQEAVEQPESPLPVATVTRRARRTLFLVDREAASLLSRSADAR